LLKDPNFYIALGTLLALVLSQVPPLRLLLRRARLTVLPFRRIVFYHSVGNANCNLFLLLENRGGRRVTVNGIAFELSAGGKNVMTLPAQGYWTDFEAKVEYPLTRFYLEPGQTWAHTIHCFEELNREDERRWRDCVDSIRKDIFGQIQADQAAGITAAPTKVAEEANVAKAMKFFQDHFRYEVAEYVLTIRVECSPASASSPSTHRFTLFESDVAAMRRQTERFKYGDGIYFTGSNQESFVSVRLQ